MSAMVAEDDYEDGDEAEEAAAVVDTDSMPDDIFVKHLNARHMPIATMTHIPEGHNVAESPARRVLRAYHERCHALGVPHGVFGGHYHTDQKYRG